MDKWDARFMELAGVIANWASCYKANRKIGAVIVKNKRIVTTTTTELFGHAKGVCAVEIGSINFESGRGLKPAIDALEYGVYDPENRLRGYAKWFQPWGEQQFPVFGAANFHVTHFGD